jgi:hypothetical protein
MRMASLMVDTDVLIDYLRDQAAGGYILGVAGRTTSCVRGERG